MEMLDMELKTQMKDDNIYVKISISIKSQEWQANSEMSRSLFFNIWSNYTAENVPLTLLPLARTSLVRLSKRRSSKCFSLSKITSATTNTILKITGDSLHQELPVSHLWRVAVRPSHTGCWLCIETSSRTGRSRWAGRMRSQKRSLRWFPGCSPSCWSPEWSSPPCTPLSQP